MRTTCFMLGALATALPAWAAAGDQWILQIHHVDNYGVFTPEPGQGYAGPYSWGDSMFVGNAVRFSGTDGVARVYWHLEGHSINNSTPVPAETALYRIEFFGVTGSGHNDWQPIESQVRGSAGEVFPIEPTIPWVGSYGTNHQYIGSDGQNNGLFNLTGPGPHTPNGPTFNAGDTGTYMWLRAASRLYVKWDFTWPIDRSWSALRLTQITPLASCAANPIIYVNAAATGAGTGTTWSDAFTDLQSALTAASWCPGGPARQIWVAQGTYMPDGGRTPVGGPHVNGSGNRNASFLLLNNLSILGGFRGQPGDENVIDNTTRPLDQETGLPTLATVLSGDLTGNDVPADFPSGPSRSENSSHVVMSDAGLTPTAVLNGVTISGGSVTTGYGAGLHNNSGSPTLTHCTFSENSAPNGEGGGDGGGMYNGSGSPILTRCTFSGNWAVFGGGMYNESGSPTLAHCTFTKNWADDDNVGGGYGAGMYNSSGNPTLTNCTFSGNSAEDRGGGMYHYSGSPTLTNCTFSRNSARFGGGMYHNSGSLTLANAILWGNIAPDGPQIFAAAAVMATYCDIDWQGGVWPGTGNINADPLFLRNPSDGGDGWGDDPSTSGIDEGANDDDGDLRLRGFSLCIEAGNNAAIDAAGVTTDLTGNSRKIDGDGNGTLTVDMGAYEVPVCPAVPGGRLYVDASATGAGDGSTWTDAFPSLADALQLFATCANTSPVEIWVADGTYHPDGGYKPTGGAHVNGSGERNASFWLANNVAIYGGFRGQPGDEGVSDNTTRPLDPQTGMPTLATILSGDLSDDDAPVACTQDAPDCGALGGRCVDGFCVVSDNNGENSLHVVTGSGVGASALLDGFTIKAGNASNVPTYSDWSGGGLYSNSGNPILSRCSFRENFALSAGGGVYNSSGSPSLTNCTFSRNSVFYYDVFVPPGLGGGMYNDSGSPTLTNCTFAGNSAAGYEGGRGGGMYNVESSPTLANCTFSENLAGNEESSGSGGGICNLYSGPTVTDCTFSKNSAADGGGMYNSFGSPTLTNCAFGENAASFGGGMYNSFGSPTLTNCTFTRGWAWYVGGGMHNSGSSPVLTRCLFSGNSAHYDAGGGMSNFFDSSPTLTNCIFNGNSAYGGGGMRNYNSSPTLTNSTFSGNSAGFGGGMYNSLISNPTLTNVILWGNSAPSGPQIHVDGGTVTAMYCDIQGGWPGIGNINADPLFVRNPSDGGDGWGNDPGTLGIDEAANDDYGDLRLLFGSPCVDAGNNADVPAGVTEDLADRPRFADDLAKSDTGAGTPPIVDMGAYERPGTPVITQQPGNQTILVGQSASFTIVATGVGTLAYRWQKNGVDLADGGHYSGTATATLTVINADAADAAEYRCMVTDDLTTSFSNAATLTVLQPAVLQVTPANDLTSTGQIGGPFSPAGKVYTLTNTGQQALDWTAGITQPWVQLSKTSGILAGGANDTVTVSFTTQANALAIGPYNDVLTLTNLINHAGDTTRAVSLTVQEAPTFHVSTAGNDSNDGLTWATAKLTVQAALAAASPGHEVWVAAGTYYELITLNGEALYGGFAGTETALSQRNWTANETILDAGGFGTVVTVPSSATTTTRLDGFTVLNGSAAFGGGIYCEASLVLANNVIKGNIANFGGGVCCLSGSPQIRNTVSVGNVAVVEGGGLYCSGSSPALTNCTIAGNLAITSGGAMYFDSPMTITNSIFAFNAPGLFDGGSGGLQIRNSCLNNNGDPADALYTGQNGNIPANPLFYRNFDPGPDMSWGTPDDDYGDLRLQAGSGCIDSGSNADADAAGLVLDLAGLARKLDGDGNGSVTVDMGAYEAGCLPVTIITQPQPITTCSGMPASFMVGATGAGLTHQWQASTDGGANFLNLDGATEAGYVFTLTASDDGHQFRCVVSGTCSPPVASNAAALTVHASPVIVTHPQPQLVCDGGTVVFTAAAMGYGGLTYQWRKDSVWLSDGPSSGGSSYADTMSATLTIANAAASDTGNYDVVVEGPCIPPAVSNPASLTVLAPVAGDFNHDCAVDAADLAVFEQCASGPAVPYVACSQVPDCWGYLPSDLDHDGDVDSDDFGSLQRKYTVGGYAYSPALWVAAAFDNFADQAALDSVWSKTAATTYVLDGVFGYMSAKALRLETSATTGMYYRNLGGRFNGTDGAPLRLSFRMYLDPSRAGTNWGGARQYCQLRSYSGGSYNSGTLQNLVAIGLYNIVDVPGETYTNTRYQGRVLVGCTLPCNGWRNLDAAPVARTADWHLFGIEITCGEFRFLVDGTLVETVARSDQFTFDTVLIGSGLTSTGQIFWVDDVEVSGGMQE